MSAEKIAYRAFTRNDWIGFAGAEAFPDGPPMIGELTVDGRAACVVIDLNGVVILFDREIPAPIDDPSGEYLEFFEVYFPKERLTRVVAALGKATSVEELVSFGGKVEPV